MYSTKVGERGITLSGGQKQRVTLARAAYTDADIVLLDDPLSAVDAQVGHHLLQHCILGGPLAHRTRILVTHHLDVLPRADIVIMMESDGKIGKIVQQGNYQALVAAEGPFRQLVEEYGSKAVMNKSEDEEIVTTQTERKTAASLTGPKEGQALMLEEEKEIGSVALSTWGFWIRNMGPVVVPIMVGLVYLLSSGARVTNTLWVGFWQQIRFPNLSTGAYQGIYAGTCWTSRLLPNRADKQAWPLLTLLLRYVCSPLPSVVLLTDRPWGTPPSSSSLSARRSRLARWPSSA